MLSTQSTQIIKGRISKFRDLELARSYAVRCVKPHWIVLGDHDEDGDNGEYWVVTPADAQRLERTGYELIS